MEFKKAKELYKLISKNQKLADKRHPLFEKNKAMKIFTWVMVAFWAAYLILFGVMFANIFENDAREAYDTVNGGFIIILILDFFVRFGMQETPAHEVKPYKLMPIPTNFLMDVFLVKIGLKPYNLFWWFFFVPFGFSAVLMMPFYGLINYLSYLVGVWLMIVLNSYWYLIWRTLINQKFWWFFLPVLIYGALVYFGMIDGEWLFYGSMIFMQGFITLNPLTYLGVLAAITVLFFINRYIQRYYVYVEIAKVDKIKKVKSQEMSFLNHYGIIGEYLKLEIKSIIRNNVVRKMFIYGVVITLMFCCVTAFSETYDAGFMKVFICVYCFSVYGIMTLTNVMGVEGNYIDGLMSRKESVLALLKAKYYFTMSLLIIPMLFMIAPLCTGKFTLFEILGCLFFTAGCIYPCLFILAIFNNTTLNLTKKMTQRTNNTKAQMFVSLAALFLPMIIMYTLVVLCGNDMCGIIMSALGLVGVALHPIWMNKIYKQFMNRRYENMSSFRSTRFA